MHFCLEGFELWVDQPGVGAIIVRTPRWQADVRGADIGFALHGLTQLALSTAPDTLEITISGMARPLTVEAVRRLLPDFQQAAILAIGGAERYDRAFPPADPPPAPPLCVHCNAGASDTENQMPFPRCEQHGHQPFGTDATWEQAQERHAWARRVWDSRHHHGNHPAQFS